MKRQKTVGKVLALTLILSIALQPSAIKAMGNDTVADMSESKASGILSSLTSGYNTVKDFMLDTWNDKEGYGKAKVIGTAAALGAGSYGAYKGYKRFTGNEEQTENENNNQQPVLNNPNPSQQNEEEEEAGIVSKLWKHKYKIAGATALAGLGAGCVYNPSMNSAAKTTWNTVKNNWSKVVSPALEALKIAQLYDYISRKVSKKDEHETPGQTDADDNNQTANNQPRAPRVTQQPRQPSTTTGTNQPKRMAVSSNPMYAAMAASAKASGQNMTCSNGRCGQ